MNVPGELSAMLPDIVVPSAHNALYLFALSEGRAPVEAPPD